VWFDDASYGIRRAPSAARPPSWKLRRRRRDHATVAVFADALCRELERPGRDEAKAADEADDRFAREAKPQELGEAKTGEPRRAPGTLSERMQTTRRERAAGGDDAIADYADLGGSAVRHARGPSAFDEVGRGVGGEFVVSRKSSSSSSSSSWRPSSSRRRSHRMAS
jgi:hypothetical protein